MVDYQTLAQRTCPESYHVGAVPAGLLQSLMLDAINALNALDAVKKAFAYGRTLPAGLKGHPEGQYKGDLDGHVLHAILGVATESGELLEAALKTLANGDIFDMVNFQEEMGDIAWYRAIGLAAAGQTIEENNSQNINKLRARFPDKYDDERALNRDLDAERVVLEGVTATLSMATLYDYGPEHQRVRGTISGDTKGRFKDGEVVHTSRVTKVDNDFVWTLNSKYRIDGELIMPPTPADEPVSTGGGGRDPSAITPNNGISRVG